MRYLRHLQITSASVSASFLAACVGGVSLDRVVIQPDATGVDSLASAIAAGGLYAMSLFSTSFADIDAGSDPLAAILGSSWGLTVLELDGVSLTGDAARALGRALARPACRLRIIEATLPPGTSDEARDALEAAVAPPPEGMEPGPLLRARLHFPGPPDEKRVVSHPGRSPRLSPEVSEPSWRPGDLAWVGGQLSSGPQGRQMWWPCVVLRSEGVGIGQRYCELEVPIERLGNGEQEWKNPEELLPFEAGHEMELPRQKPMQRELFGDTWRSALWTADELKAQPRPDRLARLEEVRRERESKRRSGRAGAHAGAGAGRGRREEADEEEAAAPIERHGRPASSSVPATVGRPHPHRHHEAGAAAPSMPAAPPASVLERLSPSSVASRNRRRSNPEAPRTPRSAFVIYRTAMRSTVRQGHPGQGSEAISRIISQMWNRLPSPEKQPFIAQSDREKASYRRQMDAYKSRQRREDSGAPARPGAFSPEPRGADHDREPPKRRRAPPPRYSAESDEGGYELEGRPDAEGEEETGYSHESQGESRGEGYDVAEGEDEDEDEEDEGAGVKVESDSDEPYAPASERRASAGPVARKRKIGARAHPPGCTCPFHPRARSAGPPHAREPDHAPSGAAPPERTRSPRRPMAALALLSRVRSEDFAYSGYRAPSPRTALAGYDTDETGSIHTLREDTPPADGEEEGQAPAASSLRRPPPLSPPARREARGRAAAATAAAAVADEDSEDAGGRATTPSGSPAAGAPRPAMPRAAS
eukprot:tig00020684_g12897.t1